jgi:sulfatase maturation enzyme AslB (radical SAM superfamily)
MPSYHPLNIEVINPHETFKTLGASSGFFPSAPFGIMYSCTTLYWISLQRISQVCTSMRSRYQESNSSWHYCHGKRSKGKSNKSQTLSLCHAGNTYCQSSRIFAKGSCKRPWLERSLRLNSVALQWNAKHSHSYTSSCPHKGRLGLSGVPNHLYLGIIDGLTNI